MHRAWQRIGKVSLGRRTHLRVSPSVPSSSSSLRAPRRYLRGFPQNWMRVDHLALLGLLVKGLPMRFGVWRVPLSSTLLWALGCSITASPPAAPQSGTTRAQITILYDAFGKPSALKKDWGYAALVEYGGKRILFDTGNNPSILRSNTKAMEIDLATLDFVVMSHRHGDHMGGMAHLLNVNPRVKIYAPKESFGVYGADLPSSFYRKDDTLPPEQRYYDGKPPEVLRFGAAWPGANIQLVDKTTQIAPGVHLIALVSDKPGTLELRELSLALDTPDGMVIIVGCSHPGIDNIVKAAAAINPRINFIA